MPGETPGNGSPDVSGNPELESLQMGDVPELLDVLNRLVAAAVNMRTPPTDDEIAGAQTEIDANDALRDALTPDGLILASRLDYLATAVGGFLSVAIGVDTVEGIDNFPGVRGAIVDGGLRALNPNQS